MLLGFVSQALLNLICICVLAMSLLSAHVNQQQHHSEKSVCVVDNNLRAGIPIEKVSSDESEKLIKMEETLHTRVIGQEEAVVAISRAIRRARVGM